MYNQILRTNIRRNVWRSVRRIYILILERVGVLTCSWQQRTQKCFDWGTSVWEEYSWQRRDVGLYTQTGDKNKENMVFNTTTVKAPVSGHPREAEKVSATGVSRLRECVNTVEALWADTLVSGQLYLRPPWQNLVCTPAHTNSVFAHSCKRPAPEAIFYS